MIGLGFTDARTGIGFNDLGTSTQVAGRAIGVTGAGAELVPESVTVTVFAVAEMYVERKRGFRIKLEASLSSNL